MHAGLAAGLGAGAHGLDIVVVVPVPVDAARHVAGAVFLHQRLGGDARDLDGIVHGEGMRRHHVDDRRAEFGADLDRPLPVGDRRLALGLVAARQVVRGMHELRDSDAGTGQLAFHVGDLGLGPVVVEVVGVPGDQLDGLETGAGDAADGIFIGRLPLERPGRGTEPHGSTPWFLRRMRAKSVLQMEKRPLPGPLLQETTRTASNRGLFFSRQALRPPRLPRRPTPPISPRPSFFRRRVDVSVRSRRLLCVRI